MALLLMIKRLYISSPCFVLSKPVHKVENFSPAKLAGFAPAGSNGNFWGIKSTK